MPAVIKLFGTNAINQNKSPMKKTRPMLRWSRCVGIAALASVVLALAVCDARAQSKPNILVIFGDDIGIANLSCYSDGLMGYETPNIDRIGREGIRFLDYYGEQSCTAGLAAFL